MKVLIVEDSPYFLKLVKTIAEREGHETRLARDGLQGLEIFSDFNPDLVLSDIQMPNMSGLELLRAIRKRNADTIVVMITAHESEEYVVEALRLRAQNYVRKPCSVKELVRLLNKYEIVVANRTLEREIMGMIIRRELTMKIDNRVDLVPRVADYLMREAADTIKREEWLGVQLGLNELLMNAIEHGNLGITFDEKREALAISPDEWSRLFQKRLQNPILASRWTTIEFKLDVHSCEWIITDEGDGFDWRLLPDPLEEKDPEVPQGRGIFISRFQFDELEYLGTGNQVRIRKKRWQPQP